MSWAFARLMARHNTARRVLCLIAPYGPVARISPPSKSVLRRTALTAKVRSRVISALLARLETDESSDATPIARTPLAHVRASVRVSR